MGGIAKRKNPGAVAAATGAELNRKKSPSEVSGALRDFQAEILANRHGLSLAHARAVAALHFAEATGWR